MSIPYKRKYLNIKSNIDLALKSFVVAFLITVMFAISSDLFSQPLISPVGAFAPAVSLDNSSPQKRQEPRTGLAGESNPEEIIDMFFGVHAQEAQEVAQCESGLQPFSKSHISTAKGLFQIIDGTWKTYRCDGDPLNAVDNTRCAKKIYDHQKSWNTKGGWKASYSCHKQV
jgi:hypothetical protein